MTKKRKASLGLGALTSQQSHTDQTETATLDESERKPEEDVTTFIPEIKKTEDQQKINVKTRKKKQVIPLYIEPALHEALHTLVFSERHKKTTFQTLFIEGLDLALQARGLPSVSELSSGDKVLNP